MNRVKNDGKDIYRRRAFSGKIERDLEKEYSDFMQKLGKIPGEPPNLRINFFMDIFGLPGIEEKNEDLKVILLCKDEKLQKMLIDLGNQGANLKTIWNALRTPDIDEYLLNGHPVGLQLREGELSPYWDEEIRKYDNRRREFCKSQNEINKAIDVIASLKPVPGKHYEDELAFANTKLMEAQNALSEFQRMIKIYFNGKAKEEVIGYPAKWGMSVEKLLKKEFRPFTQKSHKIWNERIVILVDELRKIYSYKYKQAYIKAGQLLNLAFPHVYKDEDADLIRQRYTYQTRNRKGAVPRNKTLKK